MTEWSKLKEEMQGGRGLVAWVRKQVIPEGKDLAREARERVWKEYWQGKPLAPAELQKNIDHLFCSLLDTEYQVYLEYEDLCAQRAPELVLSEEGIRRFPQVAKLLRSALDTIEDASKPTMQKLNEIAVCLRPFYRLFEQSLAQGRMGRAGGSAQIHLGYLLNQLGYTGEFETQQVLNGKVDFLFPSRRAWNKDRQKCIIVSVKRSLRERYKQVFEELGITGGLTVYLVITEPADEARRDLTTEKVENIKKQNIYLVVRDSVKQTQFPEEQRVLGFTQFFTEELPLRRQLWKPLLEAKE
jgi:hypothetical protein